MSTLKVSKKRVEKIVKHSVEASTSEESRPRTRAWTKLQAQLRNTSAGISTPTPDLSLQDQGERNLEHAKQTAVTVEAPVQIGRTGRQTTNKRGAENQTNTKAKAKGTTTPKEREDAPSRSIQPRKEGARATAAVQRRKVSGWLSHLESDSPGLSSSFLTGDLPLVGLDQSDNDMDSSDATSKDSAVTSEGGSTLMGTGEKKNRALSWDKLRVRRVLKGTLPDEQSQHIQSKIVLQSPRPKFKDFGALQTMAREFLQECDRSRPNQDGYEAIEKLANRFNQWKPDCHLASITRHEFEMDLAICKSSNEAVLQRTIMLSIIDRWQLHELFIFNCEGQWKLQPGHLLPCTGRMQETSLPRPDLAIFFKLSALTGPDTSAPYPAEIRQCLHPDGGDERCFPFLFLEVKRAAGNLETAFRANLHSASQALYNIFIWMSQAQDRQAFLDNVRVFTMDLNAQEINLRIHRAVLDEQNCLWFRFSDMISLVHYTKDQACQLVRNVLVEYAEKVLHGILQRTFQEVSRQERILAEAQAKKEQIKRKAEMATAKSSKRSRSRHGSVVPPLPQPPLSSSTTSFGASSLSLTGNP